MYVITSLRTGGAEKLVVELTSAMREMGHIADVALFDGYHTPLKEELQKTGCRIYDLHINDTDYPPVKSFYSPRRLFQLSRVMKGYDVVHTHNTAPQLFAAIAKFFGRKAKLVTTEHNTTNARRDKSWLLPFDRWMYNRYRKVICISDQAHDNLVSYIKHTKAEILTIKNGVNLKTLHEASPIEGFKKDPSRFTVLMVSAFRAQKDHKTLLQAMSLLGDGYELFLAGDGELRGQMENFCKELGLEERVHFLGNRSDVPSLLKSADAVVMSSHYEGLSLSSIEGMAVDKPFVASDVDGLHEIVEGAGILVEHQNPQALADALRRLKEDPAYCRSVAESCRKRASEYDFSKMAAAYNSVYESL